MGHALIANGGELSLLTYLLKIEELPGLLKPDRAGSSDNIPELCDSMLKKGLLETRDGKTFPSSKATFLMRIAAVAVRRIEIRTFHSGEITHMFNLYAQGEDLLLTEFDPVGNYRLLWISSLPLAMVSIVAYFGKLKDDDGRETFPCKDALECTVGMDASKISISYESCFSNGTAETIFVSFIGGEEETMPMLYMRYKERLYTKQGNNFVTVTAADAIQPISKWLVYAHRAELLGLDAKQ